jgi:NAD(P)-dependent dehydrogenase (short-subunit alcohol dehydrogenase family)
MTRASASAPASAAGALLELARVASYPATGYWLRRRAWDPAALDVDLTGKVCVVTGASRGLGFAAARALARRGAHVVMVCRDPGPGEVARRAIAAEAGERSVSLERCDLAELAAVRALAARLAARLSRLDVLLHNAGALYDELHHTSDGHEATFATNVLAGYHLTRRVLPLLRAAAPSRIIHVGSAAMYLARLDAAGPRPGPRGYSGERAYAASKRALAELSGLWAERLAGTGVTSNLMHPGLTATPGVARTFPRYHRWLGRLLRDPDQGADTMVWLAVARAAAGESGKLWFDRRARPSHLVPWTRCDDAERHRLWDRCAALCGLPAELGATP